MALLSVHKIELLVAIAVFLHLRWSHQYFGKELG